MRNRCSLCVTAIAAILLLAGCDDGDGSGDAGKPADAAADTTAAANTRPGGDQPLPSSLKGYELYAWDEGVVVWFTLVTGTNRNKTLDEVSQKHADVRQDGFVLINSSGWDDLQRILSLVPRGTPVVFGPSIAGLPALGPQSRARITQMLQALDQ